MRTEPAHRRAVPTASAMVLLCVVALPGCPAGAPCEDNRCPSLTEKSQVSSEGDAPTGTQPVVDAPLLVAPPSLAIVQATKPSFSWRLPEHADGAIVDICRARDCVAIAESIPVAGSTVRANEALAPGVWFWRVRPQRSAVVEGLASMVWQFTIPAGTKRDTFDLTNMRSVDVNGDGLADFVVGAPSATSGGGARSGTAQIGYGSKVPDKVDIRLQTLARGAANARFGQSVAAIGDVDGDGYGDVAVGAPGSGEACVYVGGSAGLGDSPAFCVPGPDGASRGGLAVGAAGDVDRDGYGDFLVGATGGAARLVFGGRGRAAIDRSVMLPGSVASSDVSAAVASAGDVNADGFADVIIGDKPAGTARIYLGSANGLVATPALLNAVPAAEEAGAAVASAGDFNCDGFADVAVGAPSGSAASTVPPEGVVRIYLGGATGITTAPWKVLAGAAAGEAFGSAVAALGDVDGDGCDDIAIGAPRATSSAGAVRVFFGSRSPTDTLPGPVLNGSAGERFGAALASGGDIDGDGVADLHVGAPAAGAGVARLFFGATGGSRYEFRPTPFVLNGTTSGDELGSSVARLRPVRGRRRAEH